MDPGDILALNSYDVGLMQAQAYRALTLFMSRCLVEFELSMIEWGALGRICDGEGLRVTDIADELMVEVPRIIFLLKRLETKGYIARETFALDRRVVVISSTAAGQLKKIEVETVVKDRLRYFLLGVKDKDLVAYVKVLRFLSAKLYK